MQKPIKKTEKPKYGVSAHCYKLMQEAGKDVSMFQVFVHIGERVKLKRLEEKL